MNKYPKAVIENTLKSVKEKIAGESTPASIVVGQDTTGTGVVSENTAVDQVNPHDFTLQRF